MRIRNWKHINVDEKGIIASGGAVHTEPAIKYSANNGGCGSNGCHCSDGHWICLCNGRDAEKSEVSGTTLHFDDIYEMQQHESIYQTEYNNIRNNPSFENIKILLNELKA